MNLLPYLTRYAEPDATAASDVAGDWEHVLCIPAYKESPVFLERLAGFNTRNHILCILMVNAPACADAQSLAITRSLLSAARSYPLLQHIRPWLSLHALQANVDLLVLENCSPGRLLPPARGVGLARKTLCDLACLLMAENKIRNPWLFSTDADVHLPPDYFSTATHFGNSACMLYPFRHLPHPDNDLHQAQQLYDFSLHYYVAGLRYAASPYAFHTIGSTMAIHADAYSKVRGFPPRNAAEDFYMLNKLAKVGTVISLEDPELNIESRSSDRVPFGTGLAIEKIARLQNSLAEYLYYDPQVFICLKTWLDALPALWLEGSALEPGHLKGVDKGTAATLFCILRDLGVQEALLHARQHGRREAGFLKHMHGWFDAFRTLKCIHALRDRLYPSVPLKDDSLANILPCLDSALFRKWQELVKALC